MRAIDELNTSEKRLLDWAKSYGKWFRSRDVDVVELEISATSRELPALLYRVARIEKGLRRKDGRYTHYFFGADKSEASLCDVKICGLEGQTTLEDFQ